MGAARYAWAVSRVVLKRSRQVFVNNGLQIDCAWLPIAFQQPSNVSRRGSAALVQRTKNNLPDTLRIKKCLMIVIQAILHSLRRLTKLW